MLSLARVQPFVVAEASLRFTADGSKNGCETLRDEKTVTSNDRIVNGSGHLPTKSHEPVAVDRLLGSRKSISPRMTTG